MSIEAMSWALTVPLGGNQKVLLLGLANHAHPDGSEAYPVLDTLAQYAHCDRSTARRNVRKLVDDGWVVEDGLGPKGQTKYRLALWRHEAAGWQNATGGMGAVGGVASEPGGGGIAVPPEPSLNRPENRPSPSEARARAVADVWEHYEAARKAVIPRSNGCKLGGVERRLIRNALSVRSVDDCKAAIDGLFRSDYHRQGGFIGIKYALLGGGRSPDPATTIDRLANGRGSGGRGLLADKTFLGRSWDELTERERENVRDATAMGLEVWDGGAEAWQDREQQLVTVRAHSASAPHSAAGAVTAATFLED